MHACESTLEEHTIYVTPRDSVISRSKSDMSIHDLRMQRTTFTRKGKVLIRKLIGSWSQWEEVAEMSAIIMKRFLLGGWIGVRVLRLRKCLHSLADTNYFWGLPYFSKLLPSCAFIFFQFNSFHESCIFKHHKSCSCLFF